MKFTHYKQIEKLPPNNTEIVIESYRRKVTLLSKLDMVLLRGFVHITGLASKSNILIIESKKEILKDIRPDFLDINYDSDKKRITYSNGSRIYFLETQSIALMPNVRFDLIVINHDKFEEKHIDLMLSSLYPERGIKYGRLVVFGANDNLIHKAKSMDGWMGFTL
jgi:hypothetical protein